MRRHSFFGAAWQISMFVPGGSLWMTDISRMLETQWRMSMSRLILSIANVYILSTVRRSKLVISSFFIHCQDLQY